MNLVEVTTVAMLTEVTGEKGGNRLAQVSAGELVNAERGKTGGEARAQREEQGVGGGRREGREL